MPIVKRAVGPVHVARGPLPERCLDDLEASCVQALAGLVLQLSEIARAADEMFSELSDDLSVIAARSKALGKRTVEAKARLAQLNMRKQGG